MRTLIICAALALAACQQPADKAADAPTDADMAIDATPTDATGDPAVPLPAAAPTPAPSAPRSETRTRAAPPAPEISAPAAEAVMTGPSPEVRDAAKEKAEETNLHPKH